jgi:hypothetical protein
MEERALEALVREVEGSEDPIQTVQRLVMESGGFWNQHSPANQVDLFQIQLGGVQGTGIGISAALRDWLHRAHEASRLGALADQDG